MDTKIKERCIYCGGDVYYHGDESLIKCDWCGQTVPVMKFQGEMTRIKKTIEENAQIKEQLKVAEKEKQAANDRLFAALSDLGQIRDEQDTLGKVVHKLTEGQGDALQSLEFLKGVSERLINTQNDIFGRMGVMQEIGMQLKKNGMADQEFQSVMNEFMMWSQQIQQDDMHRLQEITKKADSLYAGQKEIREKSEELQKAVARNQETLDGIHNQHLEKIRNLYEKAETAQAAWEFDKAQGFYEQVLTEGGKDPEVYWRILICHYGLTYQKNDMEEWVPVILRPDLREPDMIPERCDMKSNMEDTNRDYYVTELKKIDSIIDSYRNVRHDWQFDVFISVKQSIDGNYTTDRNTGLDIYNFLKAKGLKVFNSEVTKIPSGDLYEPYIISALLSSKVMIVIGSCKENMESQWVKNEWSRFQWLQYQDKKITGKTERKLLCYLTNGMQPRDIPKGLDPNRQAIMDGVQAHDAMLEAVREILPFSQKIPAGQTEKVLVQKEAPFETVMNQIMVWLFEGDYQAVIDKYESLKKTGMYLDQPKLHLYVLCARNQVDDPDQLQDIKIDLRKEGLFKLAMKQSKGTSLEQDLKRILDANQANKRPETKKKDEVKAIISSPETEHKDNIDESVFDELKKAVSKNELINKGTQKSENKSVKELGRQKNRKLMDSIFDANGYYQLGEEAFKEKKYEEAVKWYQEADKSFHSEAAYKLGRCYKLGLGVARDDDKARSYYVNAAFRDHPDACYELGGIYSRLQEKSGKGYLADSYKEQSISYYQKAFNGYKEEVENGNKEAMLKLAECYRFGHGTPLDKGEAVKWYRKASDLSDYSAMFSLGECYERGEGVPVNTEEAAKWFKKAAINGLINAQYKMGLFYEEGKGVPKNKEEAKKWYSKAAEKGHNASKQNLERLMKKKWFFI